MVRLKKDSRIVVIFIGSVSSKLDTPSSGELEQPRFLDKLNNARTNNLHYLIFQVGINDWVPQIFRLQPDLAIVSSKMEPVPALTWLGLKKSLVPPLAKSNWNVPKRPRTWKLHKYHFYVISLGQFKPESLVTICPSLTQAHKRPKPKPNIGKLVTALLMDQLIWNGPRSELACFFESPSGLFYWDLYKSKW